MGFNNDDMAARLQQQTMQMQQVTHTYCVDNTVECLQQQTMQMQQMTGLYCLHIVKLPVRQALHTATLLTSLPCHWFLLLCWNLQ